MTPLPVRVRVGCPSCRARIRLSQDQYRELVRSPRLALVCPQCANSFEYSPLPLPPSAPTPAPTPPPVERPAVVEPPPARASAPEFPPPPFASLVAGAPADAPPPPFAPLAGAGSAPAPAADADPAQNAAPQLTLNDRFKKLPPWVQWAVIGGAIVVLAVVIFAIPTGGGGDAAPREGERRPATTAREQPPDEGRTPQERQP